MWINSLSLSLHFGNASYSLEALIKKDYVLQEMFFQRLCLRVACLDIL